MYVYIVGGGRESSIFRFCEVCGMVGFGVARGRIST